MGTKRSAGRGYHDSTTRFPDGRIERVRTDDRSGRISDRQHTTRDGSQWSRDSAGCTRERRGRNR